MAQQILQFVAVTSSGRAFDIDFPLHPQTQSAPAVSDLVTRLLDTISEHAHGRERRRYPTGACDDQRHSGLHARC